MTQVQRATLPQEFFDITSAALLVQPEPMYLHSRLIKMALSASFDVGNMLGLPMPERQFGGLGANYQTNPEDGRLMLSDGLYDQSVVVVPELGKSPGHTVRINRPSFANTTYTQASREVPSGTTISTVPIAVGSEQTSCTLRRFAGPYDQTNSRVAPFGIDRFDGSVMLHRPAQITGLNLKRDFDRTLDTFGVKLFDNANLIVRPNGMSSDNTPATAGDYPFSWSLMQSAERQLDDASIPYFPNGKRLMVLHPTQAEQLSNDPVFQRMARYDNSMNPLFRGTYYNSIGTWDIFKSSTLTTTTSSSGSQPTVYYGQAFGPGAVGAGAGDMPRTAYNTQDNYGETALVIWLWYAGFEVLDNRFIARLTTS
jgi:hypothetical protein